MDSITEARSGNGGYRRRIEMECSCGQRQMVKIVFGVNVFYPK